MNFSKLFHAVVAVILFATPSFSADEIASAKLKIHPKVFSMVDCWISDAEVPIVTEFNLDALESNGNQFLADEVEEDHGWNRSPGEDGMGFYRYRVLEMKDDCYKIEFQSNGGGTLTTSAIIEFSITKRTLKVNGETKDLRVLRILSFASKSRE